MSIDEALRDGAKPWMVVELGLACSGDAALDFSGGGRRKRVWLTRVFAVED